MAVATEQKAVQYQKGFTLIELLIALSISAVISVLAYQAINSVVTTKTIVESHSQRMEELQRAIWWMEQDVIQAAPRPIADGLGGTLPAYQYRSDLGLELTRITQFPTPYASGGLLRVGYKLEEDILYRLVWPVIDRAPDTQPIKYPILTSVERFEVRLLKSNDQWSLNWPIPMSSNMNSNMIAAMNSNTNSNMNATLGNSLNPALPKITEVTIKLKDLGKVTRLFMGVN